MTDLVIDMNTRQKTYLDNIDFSALAEEQLRIHNEFVERERTRLLAECDLVLSLFMTDEERSAWEDYRAKVETSSEEFPPKPQGSLHPVPYSEKYQSLLSSKRKFIGGRK